MGKAKDLKNRVSTYFTVRQNLHPRTALMISQAKHIRYIIVESEIESLLLEAQYIRTLLPKYNIKLTDNKNYPLIRITGGDYPAVLYARRADDPLSIYFGPFPNTSALRMVLRVTRKIFPFQSTRNHPKRICLYHHLGLCLCPPVFDSPEFRLSYRKMIRHLTKFLEGNTKQVLKDLEKERNELSNSEFFEQAAIIQKQIDAINYITHPVHQPTEYVENPNLREDLREQEMSQLIDILKKNNVAITQANRIECYDISNTQGTNPTASMVVFTKGEKDASQYRRFKMKTKGPNDFAMMKEVITRRLHHTDWPTPDLIIVDGGKGQISSAHEVLQQQQNPIPLIGLAKREETIITPEFVAILLPKKSPALQLIMRLRNEAHRFAITYHRKLRSKKMLEK